MSRPVIKIKPTKFDIVLEVIAVLVLVAIWGIVLYYHSLLVQRIPLHFDANGQPDMFGSKSTLLVLPVFATCSHVIMIFFSYFPHFGKYYVTITEENIERQYRNAARLFRILSLSCLLFFLLTEIIFCRSIQFGIFPVGFGKWLLAIFGGMFFAHVIYFYVRMYQLR